MLQEATTHVQAIKFNILSMLQPVSILSGGQRRGVAAARSIAFAKKVTIMDEPTAALGVKESGMVIDLIRKYVKEVYL
jgi:fructose transport system ATP-binding protein